MTQFAKYTYHLQVLVISADIVEEKNIYLSFRNERIQEKKNKAAHTPLGFSSQIKLEHNDITDFIGMVKDLNTVIQ